MLKLGPPRTTFSQPHAVATAMPAIPTFGTVLVNRKANERPKGETIIRSRDPQLISMTTDDQQHRVGAPAASYLPENTRCRESSGRSTPHGDGESQCRSANLQC